MQKTHWIKEDEAAELIDLNKKYFRSLVKSGIYPIPFRTRPSGRGFQYDKIAIEKLLNQTSLIPMTN